MSKIKKPSVAGTFYIDDAEKLKNQIAYFTNNSKNMYEYKARAVIVPHAGLIYSGRLAYEGISMLDKSIKNIFVFAPAHRVWFEGISLSSYDEWQTPLGNVSVNKQINEELINEFGASYNDDAIAPEHSIEIELPLIQSVFENVNIIPVLVGKEKPFKIQEIIRKYYPNEENGFVISSDLSHYLPDNQAKEVDKYTANMIETGRLEGYQYEQACGSVSILGLVNFANERKYSLIRIDLSNSSDVTQDKSSVVGYGCWFLYEGKKNDFIQKYYSRDLLNISRKIIKAKYDKTPERVKYPMVFDEAGACFVTLEEDNQLRGCIGSIMAHQSLIQDLIQNSKMAAFNDPRFVPVSEDEIDKLKISISVLSAPEVIEFKDEEDLLNQLVPNVDGLIIRDGNHQAVYLPSVWEEIPDKTAFLNSLKVKAGLPVNHFSSEFAAYRFYTNYIQE